MKTELVQISSRTRFPRRRPMREADSKSPHTKKFRVILIQEGLGNLKDRFFYTRECLQSAEEEGIFEGVKCFADHPDAIEEQTRPERSTRDILGYFEDVKFEEAQDGRGMLTGTLCIKYVPSNEWALSHLTTSLEYQKKYQESEFVGFSINASGEAGDVALDDFMRMADLPDSIRDKLTLAQEEGISDIRPVNRLKEAQSVDFVTDAGAGGKTVQMLEQERKPMKQKKAEGKKEAEGEAKHHQDEAKHQQDEAKQAGPADDSQDDGHDDEEQDKALFAKMIKQYLPEAEGSEEAMQMAKHAYEAYQSEGMHEDEAFHAAGKHLKMAAKVGSQMVPKSPSHEADENENENENEAKKETKHHQDEAKKESRRYMTLNAQVARLSESVKRYELRDYLDDKLKSSKLPNTATKKFREALGTPKSRLQIDEAFEMFFKAYNAGAEEVGSSEFVFTEKNAYASSNEKNVSLADCLD